MCALDYVPFVHQSESEGSYQVDTKSIVQGIIIAGVTGLMVMYGTQRSLGVELVSIKRDIADVRKSVHDIRKDFYVPRH